MKFRKVFYRRFKGRRHQTTVLTSQNVQQKAQIELTVLAMFVFVSCFPLASIKFLERSQY
jgi:hypothetical protein